MKGRLFPPWWGSGTLLAGFLAMSAPALPQSNESMIAPGDGVVTAFPGTIVNRDFARGSTVLDETVLDLKGASAKVLALGTPRYIWDGRAWRAPERLAIPLEQTGLVFGVTLDDAKPANAYFTATSTFGIYAVIPDKDGDGYAERIRTGQAGARFMAGQWGEGGGPGAVWKLDGRTGEVSLFAVIRLNGRDNAGAALGNIAFDAKHRQFFVSDRDTGMIHRLNMDGRDLGHFDHGRTGRAAMGLAPVAFDAANKLDLASADFDGEDPETWGYAALERRVWGLAVHGGRLYYAVARSKTNRPEVWSVGLDEKTGAFLRDARWELTLPREVSRDEISDIAFTREGAMILAQRGAQRGSYDYSRFARPRKARVLRYWLERPDDPKTPSRWIARPEEYAVGFQPDYHNGNGGIALGYGYTEKGIVNRKVCEASLWSTGEALRRNEVLKKQLAAGGPLDVSGLQGSPARPVRPFNAPPWTSYYASFAARGAGPRDTGHMGDVEIYTPGCGIGGQAIAGAPDDYATAWNYPPADGWYYPQDADPTCTYEDGCSGPPDPISDPGPDDPSPPPPPCMKVKARPYCDTATGQGGLKVSIGSTPTGFSPNVVKVTTPTMGISLPGGPLANLSPSATVPVSGAAPGQPVTFNLCAFDKAEAKSGKPFTCCRATITVTAPEKTCEQGGVK